MSDLKTLLIIDDEEDIGEILATLLEDDFQCECASTGALGLKMATEKSYDVIITDLEMPEVAGIDIITQVRESGLKVPIFVSTGHDQTHPKVKEALEAGAQAALLKPFMDPNTIVAEIKPYLD